MNLNELLAWFPLAVLMVVGCLGLGRAVMQYRRGVGVIAIDRKRTPGQMLCDVLLGASLFVWLYLVMAYACPLPLTMVPAWLRAQLIAPVSMKVGS